MKIGLQKGCCALRFRCANVNIFLIQLKYYLFQYTQKQY